MSITQAYTTLPLYNDDTARLPLAQPKLAELVPNNDF